MPIYLMLAFIEMRLMCLSENWEFYNIYAAYVEKYWSFRSKFDLIFANNIKWGWKSKARRTKKEGRETSERYKKEDLNRDVFVKGVCFNFTSPKVIRQPLIIGICVPRTVKEVVHSIFSLLLVSTYICIYILSITAALCHTIYVGIMIPFTQSSNLKHVLCAFFALLFTLYFTQIKILCLIVVQACLSVCWLDISFPV